MIKNDLTWAPQLSIVIPCYNEEAQLHITVESLKLFLTNCSSIESYELILVNDGSKDKTWEKIKAATIEHEQYRIIGIDLAENKGKGFAVNSGIKASRGTIVIYMDADLSTDLKAVCAVLDSINDYSVIIGSRRHDLTYIQKKQGVLRRIVGKCASILTNKLLPLDIADTQCGFKAFDCETAKILAEEQTINGFAFDVELLYLAKKHGIEIKEIPITWYNDTDSRVSVLSSSIEFFFDLIQIRRTHR